MVLEQIDNLGLSQYSTEAVSRGQCDARSYGYYPSHSPSMLFGQCQIILFTDRFEQQIQNSYTVTTQLRCEPVTAKQRRIHRV